MPLGIGAWRYLVLPGVALVPGTLVARYGRHEAWLAGRLRACPPRRSVAILFALGALPFGGLTLARGPMRRRSTPGSGRAAATAADVSAIPSGRVL
jgi:hypothetical protein